MTARLARSTLATLVVLVAAVAGAATAADAPQFEENVEHAYQGEVVEIAIKAPDDVEEPTTVTIGSEEVNFLVNATVADADGDGTVALRLDTSAAGQGGTDSYLAVSDGDELRAAEQATPEIEPPLDAGDYELSLWFDGERVDVASLVLDERETPDPAETSFVYEGEEITLAAAEDQVVRGETTMEPGSSIVLRMRSSDENPFLASVETTVAEDGTFEATFDLTGVPQGAEFEVTARGEGSELASAEGSVACEDSCATETTTFAVTDTASTDDDSFGGLGGLGALALGAVLAVVGVGLLLGVFRT